MFKWIWAKFPILTASANKDGNGIANMKRYLVFKFRSQSLSKSHLSFGKNTLVDGKLSVARLTSCFLLVQLLVPNSYRHFLRWRLTPYNFESASSIISTISTPGAFALSTLSHKLKLTLFIASVTAWPWWLSESWCKCWHFPQVC